MGEILHDLPLFMMPKGLAEVTSEHANSIRGIIEGRIPADKVYGRRRLCRDKVFPSACATDDVEGIDVCGMAVRS